MVTLLIGMLLACAAPGGDGAALDFTTTGKPPTKPRAVATRLSLLVTSEADTLVTNVTWTNPSDDGKGPIDSVTVSVTDVNILISTGLRQVHGAATTSAEFRQPLPLRDATYAIEAQVCRYRSGKSACAQDSRTFVYAFLGPAPVNGVTIINTKIP
jgi:hypothetical protein